MAFPGAQASRFGPQFNRVPNKVARRTVAALIDGLTVPLTGMAILAACTWLKTIFNNATMAVPFWQERYWTDQPRLVSTAALLHQAMVCPAA
jgi:hypothetical protein